MPPFLLIPLFVVLGLWMLSAQTSTSSAAYAQHQQGLAAFRRGDANAAIQHLKRAVELNPADAEAWNDLGVIQRKQTQDRHAIEGFRTAVKLKPDFINAMYNLAL